MYDRCIGGFKIFNWWLALSLSLHQVEQNFVRTGTMFICDQILYTF